MERVLRQTPDHERKLYALYNTLCGCGHNLGLILAYLKAFWMENPAVLLATVGAKGPPNDLNAAKRRSPRDVQGRLMKSNPGLCALLFGVLWSGGAREDHLASMRPAY